MAGWAGFSEKELRRLRKQNKQNDQNRDSSCAQELSPEILFNCQQPHKKESLQEHTRRKIYSQAQNLKIIKQDQTRSACSDQSLSYAITQDPASMASSTTEHMKVLNTESMGCIPEQLNMNTDVPEDQLTELKEKSRLDQLQLEQRLMEEKNKRKKALLAKAIAERSKKTEAEAVKLKKIQKQLQALDDLLSTDISILRTRIEHACVEFSQAKKRYDRAESEFVAAKLDLHKKSQIKEQLAEHLCTIIQQNELRKYKRLEELMQQLEVETDEESLELEIEVDLQQQADETRKPLTSTTEQDPKHATIQELPSNEKEKSTKIEITKPTTEIKHNETDPAHELKSRSYQGTFIDSKINTFTES
ncbi:RAB6-interacting golgin-like [Gastrophryne carolinensis]